MRGWKSPIMFHAWRGNRACQNGRGRATRPRLGLGDEARVKALLTAAYGRPAETYVLEKMRRAAELWNEGRRRSRISILRLPFCRSSKAKSGCFGCFLPRNALTVA